MDSLKPYCNAIKHLDTAEGTEHTPRGAPENLLNTLAADKNSGVNVLRFTIDQMERIGECWKL